MDGKTAPTTEKRLKKPKNKTAEYVERLISAHFCGFPLYQFRCCDVSGGMIAKLNHQYTPDAITFF
ncbi:MAG: hypothetical protein K2P76_11290 [Lachnospiraceae bacterium]|nr:hypothetical protein [Lachnospiraceae bacterium]